MNRITSYNVCYTKLLRINCSWGGNAPINQTLQDVVNYAWAKGALVIGGAGNSVIDNDIDPFLPSSLDHVLSVSSIESNGSASTWAAYGASVHVYSYNFV